MAYILLVSDAETRKAFDIISILKTAFPKVKIILGDIKGSLKSSRHLKTLFNCNVETLRVSQSYSFVSDLELISSKYETDKIVFLPIEEHSVAFFYKFLNQYGNRNFKYILPSEDIFDTLRNKGKLNTYCSKEGLSAPEFYNTSVLRDLDKNSYPILLKPCVGSGSEGQYRLYSPNDLTTEIFREVNAKPYLAQELIGNGHDVKGAFYLYDENGFVDAYTHERIRTSPPSGGVTVLSKLSSNQDIINEGKMILDRVGWKGLIMLEFLFDEKKNKYKIIEANPRAWGSIMLSEFGGTHILTNYVRLCTGEPLQKGNHTGDVYIRWLFPVDVLNYVKKLGRIPGFWNFENTCFINWSYASISSAIKFNLWNLFKMKNLKRFFRK